MKTKIDSTDDKKKGQKNPVEKRPFSTGGIRLHKKWPNCHFFTREKIPACIDYMCEHECALVMIRTRIIDTKAVRRTSSSITNEIHLSCIILLYRGLFSVHMVHVSCCSK